MHQFMVSLMYEYESERLLSMVYDIDLLVLHWRSDGLGDEMSVYWSRVVDGKYK